MLIFSWNVLLREHEKKYNPESTILANFPVEEKRVFDIVKIILKCISKKNYIICLQECSELLVHHLKSKLESKNSYIYTHQISDSIESKEFLITISSFPLKVENIQHQGSRGFLVLSSEKYRIINCHLIPQKYTNIDTLAPFKELLKDKINIICGDFNEKYNIVSKYLSNRFYIHKFYSTYKNRQIDFIIMDKGVSTLLVAKTIKQGLSDHNPIIAHFLINLSHKYGSKGTKNFQTETTI